jgi:Tol biopolymer transport system component
METKRQATTKKIVLTKKTFALATTLVFLLNLMVSFGIQTSFASDEKEGASSTTPAVTSTEIKNKTAKLQLPFEQNVGQAAKDIKYLSGLKDGTLYILDNGELAYDFSAKEGLYLIKESFITDKKINPVGAYKTATSINNFTGSNPAKWNRNIPAFNKISLGEIFAGTTVDLQSYESNFEKIFTVTPGSNPQKIAMHIDGSDKISISDKGELVIHTSAGDITLTKPVAYQQYGETRTGVNISYKILGKNSYGFETGEYDKSKPLIIDPLLGSTYLGGNDEENSYNHNSMVVAMDPTDSQYYVYTSGLVISTSSPSFPTTTGPHGNAASGNYSIFVAKLNLSLTNIVSATLIGSGTDYERPITSDSNGNIFIAASTTSGYPTTAGAFQQSCTGNCTAISKLSPDLGTLLASTLLGGDHNTTSAESLAIDQDNNVYVSGYVSRDSTWPTTFPVTGGAYDTTPSGTGNEPNWSDGFIARFDNNLSDTSGHYIGTYVGAGSANNHSLNMAIDPSNGEIYGIYSSDNKTDPVIRAESSTPSYDETAEGNYIIKMNATLSALDASTYLPSDSFSNDNRISISGSGNAAQIIITGAINDNTTYDAINNNTHTTNNPAPIYCLGGGTDCIQNATSVIKMDSNLQTARFAVYGGNTEQEYNTTDQDGNIYVAMGTSAATQLPLSSYQNTNHGSLDILLVKFSSDLSTLSGETYLGGSALDAVTGLYHATNGYLYVNGITRSNDFPVSPGSAQITYGGGLADTFITAISDDLTAPPRSGPPTNLAAIASQLGADLTWNAPANDGGSAITGYTIRYGVNGTCDPTTAPYSGCTETTSPTIYASIGNLLYNVQYIFAVYADNANGQSDPGTTATATPICGGNGEPYYNLAFQTTGPGEIFSINTDGTNLINITNNGSDDNHPSFSPDGTRIAFSSDRDYVNGEIYTIGSDGQNLTRLTTLGGNNPVFSHDGTKIAFISYRDSQSELYIMDANGNNQTRLTNNNDQERNIVFSPDDSKIVFTSVGNGQSETFIINANGTNLINLTNGNYGQTDNPQFSPGGQRIVFDHHTDDATNITIMNTDGTSAVNLTTHGSEGRFSPDETKIIFSSDDTGGISAINTNGTNLTPITNPSVISAGDYEPIYSPNGEKIIFSSLRDGDYELYVMNTDGTNQTRLTHGPGRKYNVVFNPAGSIQSAASQTFCASQTIAASILSFISIPDSFSFPGINTSNVAQNAYNNGTSLQPDSGDMLGVQDTRNSGGFEVQVQAAGNFSSGTATIPLSGLYLATNIHSPASAQPAGTDESAPCPATNCGIIYQSQITERGILAPADSKGESLGEPSTFTANFGAGPVVIMDGGLSSATGRNGDMYQYVNYRLTIPGFQPEGNYAVILTYTLLDDTL